jgi:hypothetical protein
MNTRALALVALVACGGDDDNGTCNDDADGITGVALTVDLTIDDTAFAPPVFKTQNSSPITLRLANKGTKPHGFTVDCLPTPNSRGCPAQSCFPAAAAVSALAPGASTTLTFTTPAVEGIYTYRSPGESQTGQFILQ